MVTQLLRYQEGDFYISIHTTTQVVTEKIVHSNYTEDISIHTTTQVVTDAAGMPTLRTFISIHTTTQVVTKALLNQFPGLYISIHTTTQVVTINRGTDIFCHGYFNPHHHAGGDPPGYPGDYASY